MIRQLPLLSLVILCGCGRQEQPTVNRGLGAEIAKIEAIDNHAHPVRNDPSDKDFDAMPVESIEPWSEPIRSRNPPSTTLFQNKKKMMSEKGDGYPAWVLDQLGIQVMLANRVSMGNSLAPSRFRWVPFADAYLFPLNNAALAKINPDAKQFVADEEKLLRSYLAQAGYSATSMPGTLDEYLTKVVTATLERHKRQNAVAEKFEIAYLRSFDFGNPQKLDADRVYSTFSKATALPLDSEYKQLQDYIFRYIVKECGRLGMAVHLHSAAGAGGYFAIAGVNPLLLEPVLNDPALRKTNFVLIHGGWPFTREVTAMLMKPNVYADFSFQTTQNYSRSVSLVIREWLEFAPEKVLFATDAYPGSPRAGWEEAGWIGASTGREALGLALSGMMADGEITEQRAIELAHMVLHDNAAKLYGIR